MKNIVFIGLISISIIFAKQTYAESKTDYHPPPASHLSEQTKAFMIKFAKGPGMDPGKGYKMLRKMLLGRATQPGEKFLDGEVTAVNTDGVQSYWISSPKQNDKKHVILFMHGGAYVAGDSRIIAIPLELGKGAGMKVLSVNYALAPENQWPAGLNDSLKAHQWLIKQGYKPSNIAWAGLSSGGGLALAMANLAKEKNIPLPGAIFTMSAWADLTLTGDSYETIKASDHMMGHGDMGKLAKLYYGDADPRDPTITPLYGDLKGLPPTLLSAGSRERIVSDSIRWARTARAAGVDVTLDIWDGQMHGFHIIPTSPEARQAVQYGADFIKKHLTD